MEVVQMKKQLTKSLTLKKVTVTNLENKEMSTVKGGATLLGPLCETGPCQWSVTPTFCD